MWDWRFPSPILIDQLTYDHQADFSFSYLESICVQIFLIETELHLLQMCVQTQTLSLIFLKNGPASKNVEKQLINDMSSCYHKSNATTYTFMLYLIYALEPFLIFNTQNHIIMLTYLLISRIPSTSKVNYHHTTRQ